MSEVNYRLFRTVITVSEGDRALVLRNGKFLSILRPGRYVLPSFRTDFEIEFHDLDEPRFTSAYAEALLKEYRDVVDEHFVEVKTAPEEVALVERDGKMFGVLKPDGKTTFWSDAGPWNVNKLDVSENLEVDSKLAERIASIGSLDRVKRFNVEDGQVGLLYIDNAYVKLLQPATFAYWNVGRPVTIKLVDTRETSLDVTGQEILTKDRVSIRVNISANHRVVDAEKAVSSVKDFPDALYRALQHGFRESMGTKTLDAILADKVSVDEEVASRVREQMQEIGIEVGDISVKDVILPGEMRDILNRVVEAEKEAEANVIRRREETNATRSLLNTAKVMEENPAMLRLKELEALEKIAGKIQSLTVHSGTQGLLDDLVNLRTSKRN
ncbi:MAG: slipin family protein [Rhizobiaceae bacterium]